MWDDTILYNYISKDDSHLGMAPGEADNETCRANKSLSAEANSKLFSEVCSFLLMEGPSVDFILPPVFSECTGMLICSKAVVPKQHTVYGSQTNAYGYFVFYHYFKILKNNISKQNTKIIPWIKNKF